MSVLAAKQQEFKKRTDEAVALRDKIATAVAAGTPNEDDQKAFDALMDETIPTLEVEIKRLSKLESIAVDTDEDEPAAVPERKVGNQPARVEDRFVQAATIGEQLANSDAYKSLVKRFGPGGHPGQGEANLSLDLKGFLFPSERKDTFNLSGTGLDSSRNYLGRPVELVQQQRLTIRDVLPVGQTNQNIVYFIKETSYTNAATTVAEEGLKPEATFATTSANAPVKKIAVTAKVTDEMWSDFSMLRDYINARMLFMVQQTEEDQLLNGNGSGNNITGILNTSGIQTQANSADNLVAIHKAKTKVMKPTTGGYNPSVLVINPTDWELVRLQKDLSGQYYGGGPFVGEYGVGNYVLYPPVWGLRPVITTAIAAGTALVFDPSGAQIWQKEGISVATTNSNEDDFNYNRISLRVEERLALAVYAPGAFCTVTGLA